MKSIGKRDPFLREIELTETNFKMIQMLELAKKYFKVAMITMLKEIKEKEKESMFETTEQI